MKDLPLNVVAASLGIETPGEAADRRRGQAQHAILLLTKLAQTLHPADRERTMALLCEISQYLVP